ncbi:LemA family protein [Christensenella timonensis]|uniref:LemA family protein n=1 Tax=Christensenella timonensis TaxID=1816678 RepID=UPI00082EB55B|nr:LemA family protein [Christensenella timonensis]
MTWLWILIAVVVAIVVIIVIWYIVAYNNFIKMKNSIEEAFATIDVYLKKRFDLIPNLVETVKGYAAHEKGTLEQVTAARTNVANSTTTEERLQNENILTGTLRSLFAVAEAYPDLKANTNFLDLQNQLNMVETDIANARKYYNANVRMFNTKLETFPTNLIARKFKFTKQPMFEVENQQERENVKVQF